MLSAVCVALWAPASAARLLPTAAAALQADPDPSRFNFTGAVRNFTLEYISPSNASHRLSIYGWEPAHGSGYPVYLHAGGGGDKFDDNTPEIEMAQAMAERGFVAAIIEVPSTIHVMCESYVAVPYHSLLEFSDFIFGYRGQNDTRPTALSTMCRRATADCNAGIALHGLSVGGMLTALAPQVADGVTAELRWSSGINVAGAFSCCGLVRARREKINAPTAPLSCSLSCVLDVSEWATCLAVGRPCIVLRAGRRGRWRSAHVRAQPGDLPTFG